MFTIDQEKLEQTNLLETFPNPEERKNGVDHV